MCEVKDIMTVEIRCYFGFYYNFSQIRQTDLELKRRLQRYRYCSLTVLVNRKSFTTTLRRYFVTSTKIRI